MAAVGANSCCDADNTAEFSNYCSTTTQCCAASHVPQLLQSAVGFFSHSNLPTCITDNPVALAIMQSPRSMQQACDNRLQTSTCWQAVQTAAGPTHLAMVVKILTTDLRALDSSGE
jgi:hypothetical protein